ncbi:MAG: phage tail protein, partial [Serratia inhibens]
MAQYEIQRLPGAPKEKGSIKPGLSLVRWLDAQRLHNNVIIRLNGMALHDDFDLSYNVQPEDRIHVFDQPKGSGGLLGTLLNPLEHFNPISFTKKVMGSLIKTPEASAPAAATGESSNNDLTGQTNRARLYKGRPNIYGQVRAYPDLIQEALYEYIDNNKYIT